MNRPSLSMLAAVTVLCALFAGVPRLVSQEAPAARAKTPLQQLAELKAANAALLERQQKTLQKLDELQKQADQLRIFTKRS